MNLLVSAGPTREYFDTVRYISNPSSGRMGYAIATEAARRGHHVVLVSGPVSLPPPKGVELVCVVSGREMAAACKRAFKAADAAVMAAAVCDYRPVERLRRKSPKQLKRFRMLLEPTEDIAAALGRCKGGRLLVGFAMEDHDPRPHAERKLQKKNCDLIVLNGLGNLHGDQATVEFFSPEPGWRGPFSGSKRQVARRILREIEIMMRLRAES